MGDDIPPYPYLTPFIVFNKDDNYGCRVTAMPGGYGELKSNPKTKFIRFPAKCGWQKYFVRWNWSFVLSLNFFENFFLRGIFYRIVGAGSLHPIQLTTASMGAMKIFFINWQSFLWVYGVICCLSGCSVWFPLFNRTCRYHCGRFAPIPERLKLVDLRNPIIFYPYDKVVFKGALCVQRRDREPFSRWRKINIFLNILLDKPKIWIGRVIYTLLGFFIISILIYLFVIDPILLLPLFKTEFIP